MQRKLNLIFRASILLIVVSLHGKDNEINKPIFLYGHIAPHKSDPPFIPISESNYEKLSYQLDSSLSSSNVTNKKIVMHIHPQINVTLDGKSLVIPAGIGINTTLWNDHTLDQYGMGPMKMTTKEMNMIMQGMAPLHTHDTSGIIHVESNEFRNYTLGQFLQIWGIDLDGREVELSVNGNNIKDYKNHILTDKEQIILNIKNQKNVTSV
ncbi:MAG: hypothetical protein E6L03_03110 [Thaumarchaeota archaeon]|nr:MAG: hypothetical protein E6L03_03110 [Nitrososphaerota archaeon]